jgi:hypothetical protein
VSMIPQSARRCNDGRAPDSTYAPRRSLVLLQAAKGMPRSVLALLMAIDALADDRGRLHTSVASIIELAGMSEGTYKSAAQTLERAGLISRRVYGNLLFIQLHINADEVRHV